MHIHLQHDQRLRLLPFGTLDRIRRFGLNNKLVKNKIHLRLQQHQYKANTKNLIKIDRNRFKTDPRIIFATCNIRSMQYKELQVSHLISDYSLDFIILTETWLNSNHDLWKDTAMFNNNQLRLHTADHKVGKGGGLALVHRVQYPAKCIQSGAKQSFELAIWELRLRSQPSLYIGYIIHCTHLVIKSPIVNLLRSSQSTFQ